MQYVNASGQPLDIAALKAASKQRRSGRAAKDVYHKGWLATGFPPQQLLDAEKAHQELVAKNASTGRSTLPWDAERYMRQAKPTKIRSKPYETEAAAADAARLAGQHGWRGCTYSAITKGEAK